MPSNRDSADGLRDLVSRQAAKEQAKRDERDEWLVSLGFSEAIDAPGYATVCQECGAVIGLLHEDFHEPSPVLIHRAWHEALNQALTSLGAVLPGGA